MIQVRRAHRDGDGPAARGYTGVWTGHIRDQVIAAAGPHVLLTRHGHHLILLLLLYDVLISASDHALAAVAAPAAHEANRAIRGLLCNARALVIIHHLILGRVELIFHRLPHDDGCRFVGGLAGLEK